jgi:hypothetical protein
MSIFVLTRIKLGLMLLFMTTQQTRATGFQGCTACGGSERVAGLGHAEGRKCEACGGTGAASLPAGEDDCTACKARTPHSRSYTARHGRVVTCDVCGTGWEANDTLRRPRVKL